MSDTTLNVRTFREYDMESKAVEGVVAKGCAALDSAIERTPSKIAVFTGFLGLIISSLALYFLLARPFMEMNFGLKLFQTIQPPTKLSNLLEEVGRELDKILAKERLLPYEKFPPKLKEKIAALKREAKARSKWGLLSSLENSKNAEHFAADIREYLENTPLHFSNYPAYFFSYLFSISSHRIDLFVILIRSLLIGFLALFSARLFFQRFPLSD